MAADELLAASFPPGPVDAQQANLAETVAATASDATAFDAELGKEAAEAEAAFAKPAAMEAAEAEKTTERTAAQPLSRAVADVVGVSIGSSRRGSEHSVSGGSR